MRLPLTLPPSLHKKLAFYAAREGVDLDTFVSMAIAERLGREQPPQVITIVTTVSTAPAAKRQRKKAARKSKK